MPGPSFLAGAYAAAVDRRDLEALRSLFLPDAVLSVRRGARTERFEGHAGLAEVMATLDAFASTLHEVSSVHVDLAADGLSAHGAAVCVAHHLRPRDESDAGTARDAEDLVLCGRYTDRYVRDRSGPWRFAARELHVLWTEKRRVRLA
jgi:ketosteroid isomerase-like protein